MDNNTMDNNTQLCIYVLPGSAGCYRIRWCTRCQWLRSKLLR